MAEKVSILFKLQDQASNGIRGLKKGFSDLKGRITSVLSPANLLTGAIIGLGVAAVKQFNKFAKLETQMVNVGNLYGATREEVDGLTGELLELSKSVPQNLDDMADSLFDIVSAGVPAAESVEFLGDASKLATAGVTDTKTAVDGLTSVMNAYQVEFSKASTISDKFFAAQQKGKTTIAELSSNIGQVAPTAQAAGVGIDELLGAISALTLQGVKTSAATNQVKAALSNVIKPSEQAAKLSEALGLEFNAQALHAKGLSGFLKDVTEKTGGNTAAMAQLFGSVEALNAVLALSKNNFEALDEVQKAVTESAGATEKAYQQNLKTFSAQYVLLKNNINVLWSGLMLKLIPATTKALSKFNELFNKVADQFKVTKKSLLKDNEELQKRITKLEKKWGVFRNQAQIDRDKEQIKNNLEKISELEKQEEHASKKAVKTAESETDAILDEYDEKIKAILEGLKNEKDADQEQKKGMLDNYKSWLLKAESVRNVDHKEKIDKLQEYLAKVEEGSDAEEALLNELYRIKKSIREQNKKEEAQILLEKLQAHESTNDKIVQDNSQSLDQLESDAEIHANKQKGIFQSIADSANAQADKIRAGWKDKFSQIVANAKAFLADPVMGILSAIIDKAEEVLSALDQVLYGTDRGARAKSIESSAKYASTKLERQVTRGYITEEDAAKRRVEIEEDLIQELRRLRSQANEDTKVRLSDTLDPIGAATRIATANAAKGEISELIDAAKERLAEAKAISGFTNGGIVPGTSFSGDRVPAMVNSGELILNRQQQSNMGEILYNLSNNPSKMTTNDNSGLMKKLDQINQTLQQPMKVDIPAGDLSRATFKHQTRQLRNGQITNRGRS